MPNRALTQIQRKPEGLLRVSVPVTMGRGRSMNSYRQFLQDLSSHSNRSVRHEDTFRPTDCRECRRRPALWELRDSTLVAQRIGKSASAISSTPDYLDGRNLPSNPTIYASISASFCNRAEQ